MDRNRGPGRAGGEEKIKRVKKNWFFQENSGTGGKTREGWSLREKSTGIYQNCKDIKTANINKILGEALMWLGGACRV